MSNARPTRQPKRQPDRFGLFVFLGSYALVFATLIVVILYLRSVNFDWPPAGVPALAVWKGTLITAILLASSATLHFANRAAKARNLLVFLRLMYATLGLGLLFLVGQIWQFSTAGMTIQSGAYGAVFFTMAGFHAIHIVIGLFLLTRMLDRGPAQINNGDITWATPNAVFVWHFLDAMWLPFFLTLYLI